MNKALRNELAKLQHKAGMLATKLGYSHEWVSISPAMYNTFDCVTVQYWSNNDVTLTLSYNNPVNNTDILAQVEKDILNELS